MIDTMISKPPSNPIVDALTRVLNFKRSRAEYFRDQASKRFKENDPFTAYRCLGAAEELDLVVNDFDQMRMKIALGEPL